jgi:hypothetical protein
VATVNPLTTLLAASRSLLAGGTAHVTFAFLVAAGLASVLSWWALAWLRGTELATDIVWSRSDSFRRPGARSGLRLAGVSTSRWRSASDGWRVSARAAARILGRRR